MKYFFALTVFTFFLNSPAFCDSSADSNLFGGGTQVLGGVPRSAPVGVAIIDSPVDLSHPDLAPLIDEDALRDIHVTDAEAQEMTLGELNDKIRKEFQAKMTSGKYAQEVEFLDLVNKLQKRGYKASAQDLKIYAAGITKTLISPTWRKQLELVGTYLHGTHVAGLTMRSMKPGDARLINYPLIGVPKTLKLKDIKNYDFSKEKEEISKRMNSISEMLKRENIKVVNLSIGMDSDLAKKKMNSSLNPIERLLYARQVSQIANASALNTRSEIARLFQNNPNTLFVLAAGNEGRDLDFDGAEVRSTATLKAPNLVVVGANAKGDKRAKFSNFGPNYVDISAPGAGIESAKAGGGSIHMSGTSMAAPIVSNRLAQIMVADPSLKPEQAIKKLYVEESHEGKMKHFTVANGRVLNPNSSDTEPKYRIVKDKDGSLFLQITPKAGKSMSPEVVEQVLSKAPEMISKSEYLQKLGWSDLILRYDPNSIKSSDWKLSIVSKKDENAKATLPLPDSGENLSGTDAPDTLVDSPRLGELPSRKAAEDGGELPKSTKRPNKLGVVLTVGTTLYQFKNQIMGGISAGVNEAKSVSDIVMKRFTDPNTETKKAETSTPTAAQAASAER